MSKECVECGYFLGWDDDGCPSCDHEGGYEMCPYNDEAPKRRENTSRVEIDMEYFAEYIRETMLNTFRREARKLATEKIQELAKSEYEACVKEITREGVRKIVEQQVAEFMAGDITVGGGWSEPSRTLTRQQYMTELVEKQMSERFKKDRAVTDAKAAADDAINKFTRKLRDEINAGIKNNFNEATRQILTQNVVSMLMANDTYKKLSDSMGHLLSDGN